MLRYCRASSAGASHKRRGTPNQDSSCIEKYSDAVICAAVADGLGSEPHSDVGSQTAVGGVVSFCLKALEHDWADPEVILRSAFKYALSLVEAKASEMAVESQELDSTLTVALYIDGNLFWGQSGDSGIVVAHKDGAFELVTEMQRDSYGYVSPLAFEECWAFGLCENVASLFMCTDGLLEWVSPSLLARAGVPLGERIDRSFARQFLIPTYQEALEPEVLQESLASFLENYPENLIADDKTMVMIFDDERLPTQLEADYYQSPDWSNLIDGVETALHPGADEDISPQTEYVANDVHASVKSRIKVLVKRSLFNKPAGRDSAQSHIPTSRIDAPRDASIGFGLDQTSDAPRTPSQYGYQSIQGGDRDIPEDDSWRPIQ